MPEVDERGIGPVVGEALEVLHASCDGFLLSFDVDACDGAVYGACAAPEVGGLTAREALAVGRAVGESEGLVGVDIVEYLPERDPGGGTGRLILALIDALVGWRIEG